MDQKVAREKEMRRGEKTLALLEALSHGALFAGELCMAFSPAYGGRMRTRDIKKRHTSISAFFAEERERHCFYSLLNRLQNTGLVAKESKKGIFFWRITAKGRDKKSTITASYEKIKTPKIPTSNYPVKQTDKLIIIIFDIPEKEKHKRAWLRRTLIDLSFTLVQKSVWMGTIQLPIAFITDLKKYNILPYVKIFSAIEFGTIYE